MKKAIVTIEGTSTLSQSRHYSKTEVPEKNKESADEYERRTWRHRMHKSKTGHVEIPPMSFPRCLLASASRMSIKVKGKGQQTYTKSFEAGVMVLEPLVLDTKWDDVQPEEFFVPADGKRGGSKRVTKLFGAIERWGGTITFIILDDTITEEVFRQVLDNAGMLVGLGRFRPERGGYYGRFRVVDFKWEDDAAIAA